MTTNRDLLETARAWAEANYPGLPLEYVSLHLRGLPAAVRLVIDPIAGRSVASNHETEERGHGGIHACTRDILAALEEAGRPLTKTRLLEALAQRLSRGVGGEWSESTVCRRLAELMDDGTIENPEDARPRGYRLTE